MMMTAVWDFLRQHDLLIMDILGSLVGLWYLWLEYKAKIGLWIVGIIMPAIYLFTYYRAGLYADFGLQIYYLLAAVYGYLSWRRGAPQQGAARPVARMPLRLVLPLAGVTLGLWLAIFAVLWRFTDSDVPCSDAFINALSVTGLWMLAKKYAEQWVVWIVVNALSCVLYMYKGIPFTALFYGFYTVTSVMGYYKWLGMAKEQRD